MAQQPGGLTELGEDGRNAWDELLLRTVREARPPSRVRALADDDTPEATSPDWPAYPARVESCLTRHQAHALLDWRTEDGDLGRLLHQEEYLEWRVVRDGDGRARRIEMTTEFSDYWRVLAAHEPSVTLELIEGFAGEPVAETEVYGALDPFAPGVGPQEREAAFAGTMLPRRDTDLAGLSAYNNGVKAICCMIQPTNTLSALVNLVAAAAEPHLVTDADTGRERFMSGSEAIRVIRKGAAQDCRNSDPVVVERICRLASEGRLIAFDDPIGVYIQAVQHSQLALPDGSSVPLAWFDFDRGLGPEEAPDGRPRYQRLSFEVPGDELGLADLRQRATDQPLTHGAQLAELVRLGVYVRTSPEGADPADVRPVAPPTVLPCREQPGCDEVTTNWRTFEAST